MTELKQIFFIDDGRRAFIKGGHKLYFSDSGESGLKIPSCFWEQFQGDKS